MSRLKKDNVDVRKPRRFSRLKKIITAKIAGLTLFSYLTAPAEAAQTSNFNDRVWVTINGHQPWLFGNLQGNALAQVLDSNSWGVRARVRITSRRDNNGRTTSRNSPNATANASAANRRLVRGSWVITRQFTGHVRTGSVTGFGLVRRTSTSVWAGVSATLRY